MAAGDVMSTVSVSGQGMVNVPPDTAQVTVGIDVIRPDLAEAQAEASKQATDVIAAVKAEGVKAADIQTANYSVNIMRDYSDGGDPTRITGFEVMNQVLVTIRDVDNVGKLLDAVNPDNLLQRGYVRVSAKANGMVIASAADARAAGALTLHFRDGPVDARVERGGSKPYAGDKPEQPGLF